MKRTKRIETNSHNLNRCKNTLNFPSYEPMGVPKAANRRQNHTPLAADAAEMSENGPEYLEMRGKGVPRRPF